MLRRTANRLPSRPAGLWYWLLVSSQPSISNPETERFIKPRSSPEEPVHQNLWCLTRELNTDRAVMGRAHEAVVLVRHYKPPTFHLRLISSYSCTMVPTEATPH